MCEEGERVDEKSAASTSVSASTAQLNLASFDIEREAELGDAAGAVDSADKVADAVNAAGANESAGARALA